MVFFSLLSHGWKESLRSASRGQNTAGNIIVVVIVLLVGLNLLGIGLFLHEILKELKPGSDPVLVFNGWVLYYLGIELLLRQLFQRIPGQSILPYLTLPVRKSLLTHLLLARSFVSFINFFPWVLIIPFFVNAVMPESSAEGAVAWMAVLAFLIGTNSLLNLLLKKLSFGSFWVAAALGSLIAAVFALDYFHIFSLQRASQYLLGSVLETPILALAAPVIPAAFYGLTFVLLRKRMTLEDLTPAVTMREDTSSRYRFLETAGERGRFVALELKLFFRNRRSRATIFTGLSVLPLGILFYGMMGATKRDPYPIPAASQLESVRLSQPTQAPPGFCLVTFRIDTGVVPERTHAYITGDVQSLANWRPRALPLLRQSDSSWSRSFLFEEGAQLRYCFTLGSWQSEEKPPEGTDRPAHTLIVRGDTTIVRSAIEWQEPEIPLMVMINLIYWGLLVTGILMFAYGQFFLAWDSTFFDALLTWRIRFRWMFETKLLIMLGAGVLSFILTIPYVLMDARILLFNALAFVYNMGVNSYVLLFLASRSKKRFELNESIFSQQGKGAAQFVAILPMWILPVVIYGLLDGFGVPYAVYLYFGGMGLLGMIFYRPLLGRAYRMLEERRYEIASGFRQGGTI